MVLSAVRQWAGPGASSSWWLHPGFQAVTRSHTEVCECPWPGLLAISFSFSSSDFSLESVACSTMEGRKTKSVQAFSPPLPLSGMEGELGGAAVLATQGDQATKHLSLRRL